MDPNLQGPLKRLAEALHRAIEQSEDVDTALAAIRLEGFQAFLLLEVTVALGSEAGTDEPSQQLGFKDVAEGEEATDWIVDVPAPDETAPEVAPLRIAPQDRDFLRSIRIRLDE